MPVDPADAERVIETARAVLEGKTLRNHLPVLVVNHFPSSARVANVFRRHAAIAGSKGAEIDPRIRPSPGTPMITKSRASAFSNPELQALLQAHRVRELVVFGVFAEGCVRATVADAIRLGYQVTVPIDAIGTSSWVKRRFALWALRRAGAHLVPSLLTPPGDR